MNENAAIRYLKKIARECPAALAKFDSDHPDYVGIKANGYRELINQHQGNQADTAWTIGIPRTTLRERLTKYDAFSR